MKKIFQAVLMIFLAIPAFSQTCGFVSDEAGVIKDQSVISKAASALIDQGADVHVVTVASVGRYGSRLMDVEKAYERQCSSWVGPNGQRKANLFVLMVAPKERLKNVFFGGAYTGALPSEDSVNTVYSKYANPYFRTGQWEQGFAAAISGFNQTVVAYHDEQKHPVQATTVNQPTDLKPVAHVFSFLLWILILAGFAGILIYVLARRSASRAAQRKAILSRQRVDKVIYTSTSGYSTALYNSMTSSDAYDPNQSGLGADEYLRIADAWDQLFDEITARTAISPAATEAPLRSVSSQAQAQTLPPMSPAQRYDSYPEPATDNLATGIIIGEALGHRDSYEPTTPSYDPPSADSNSDSGSSSSWGSSGSDSSWVSSDSGSSFSSDSSWGSSDSGSSFDSGSFGGGGSDSGF